MHTKMAADVAAVTAETFDREVLGADRPVLVDFWAAWCGPCRALAPQLEKFAAEHADVLTVRALDIDTAPEVAARYRVTSIPTLLLFAGGELRAQLVGVRSAEQLWRDLSPRLAR